MSIYPSLKVLPYVYMGIHKTTGKVYYGYREANTTPSHIDIYKYKTSCKQKDFIFEEFNWIILAEFFDSGDAYDFEQSLIINMWGNPLLVNKRCYHNRNWFKSKTLGKAAYKNIITGKIDQYDTNDPRILTGELISTSAGQNNNKAAYKNIITGEIKLCGTNDPRILTGELVALSKDRKFKHKKKRQPGIPNGRKGKPNGRKGIPTGQKCPKLNQLFFCLIHNKKSYSKGNLSKHYPEFKKYY